MTIKKQYLNLSLFISLCMTMACSSLQETPSKETRPNIIIIIADQLRYQSVGFGGDKKAHTPHIDKLADEGMVFSNCVANTPVCSAFRASLITGKYASSTGIVVNELRLNPNHDTIAHVLKKSGYQTELIGKWHLWSNMAGNHGLEGNQYVPPGPYRMGFDDYWAGYNFGHDNYRGAYYEDSKKQLSDKKYKTKTFTDLAINRLLKHAKSKKPFAMVLAYSPPHDPWVSSNVPKKWFEKFKHTSFPLPSTWKDKPDPLMDRNTNPKKWLKHWKPNLEKFLRVYYAMTSSVDEQVGRLMKTLKESGLEKDTIVVFTSDHGEMFGAQGRIFKMIFYEESARIPFVIRWPGHIPAGKRSSACFSTVDMMPTFLELMGQKIPGAVEGMSLAKQTLGQKGAEPEFAYLQGMGHTYLWRDGHEWRALRDKQFTYATYLVDGSELLFDNLGDPKQSKNLVNNKKYKAVVEKFRKRFKQKQLAINDTFEKCSWYRDNWTKNRVLLKAARGPFKKELSPSVKVDIHYKIDFKK
jgi:arylsulfatase A-like enzyme